MGLFDRFRRSSRSDAHPDLPEPVAIVTDGPADWPAIVTLPDALSDHPRAKLRLLADVVRAFDDGAVSIAGIGATRLLDDGVLVIPALIEVGGRSYGLFPYPAPTDAAAAHFAAVREHAADMEWQPVYLCTSPLPAAAEPGPVLVDTHLFLSAFDGRGRPAHYAAWWPPARQDEQDGFDLSGLDLLSRIYEALDGIGGYVLTSMAHRIGALPEDQATAIPEELIVLPVMGPEHETFLLTASQEKGIRFHFDPDRTSDAYLRRFLQLFARYAEEWKAGAIERGFPLEPSHEESPRAWWALTRQVIEHGLPDQAPVLTDDLRVGVIPIAPEEAGDD